MSVLENVPIGIGVIGEIKPGYEEILTPEALEFVGKLARQFGGQRQSLLQARADRQARLDAGVLPDFLPQTESVRTSTWSVAAIPADLQDRRVEITGPVDRKMIINALNSGAKVFMADFEDANSPTWDNTIQGQLNLRDAIEGTISFSSPEGKEYQLNEKTATLMVRPRGWHLLEKHILLDGEPVSAGLVDFGLYFFHNARKLLAKSSGPYFYLPKMESYLEARLWNDIFVTAQTELGIPQGSIRATVLIETILAAFEMEEILWELRDHSAGLNCGRWDYIFSCIKKFRNQPDFLLPDRSQVTMTTTFMRSYSLLLIKTCHKRNAHAMGGMAAQIPIKGNPAANEAAFAKVREDKEREARDGHDGTWVAHPGMVELATSVFDEIMPTPNQIDRQRDDVNMPAKNLITFPDGRNNITEAGLRTNISVALQYLEAWLRGSGAVPIFNLMEDAATAEISRSQIWQWINHAQGNLNDGRAITFEMYHSMSDEELDKIRVLVGEPNFGGGTIHGSPSTAG